MRKLLIPNGADGSTLRPNRPRGQGNAILGGFRNQIRLIVSRCFCLPAIQPRNRFLSNIRTRLRVRDLISVNRFKVGTCDQI